MTWLARSTAALGCAALLLAGEGCAKRSHGIAVAAVGLGLTVASAVAIHSCSDDGCGAVVYTIVPSIAILAFGTVGALTADSQRSLAVPVGPDPQDEDPDAVALTARARVAAQAGDCGTVLQLAERVELADPEYYAGVFRADARLAACLGSPTVDAAPAALDAGPMPDAAPAPSADATP